MTKLAGKELIDNNSPQECPMSASKSLTEGVETEDKEPEKVTALSGSDNDGKTFTDPRFEDGYDDVCEVNELGGTEDVCECGFTKEQHELYKKDPMEYHGLKKPCKKFTPSQGGMTQEVPRGEGK